MKLIKLKDKFILVSDDEIKEGDYFLYDNVEVRYKSNGTEYHGRDLCHISGNRRYAVKKCKKIIAGIPELPSIDFSLLSEQDCKRIGWVDKFKIADDATKNLVLTSEGRTQRWWGVLQGLDIAQSLNDKMFSLEDMFKCFQAGINYEQEGVILQPDAHGYIQSLQQTEWDVEIEMENFIGENNGKGTK